MRQEGKDFSFVIHCDSFALWCIIVKKQHKLSGSNYGLKKLDI